MTAADKFRNALATCPAPGEGRTHSWMMQAANFAAFAGVDAAEAERAKELALVSEQLPSRASAFRRALSGQEERLLRVLLGAER